MPRELLDQTHCWAWGRRQPHVGGPGHVRRSPCERGSGRIERAGSGLVAVGGERKRGYKRGDRSLCAVDGRAAWGFVQEVWEVAADSAPRH
ncbi:hypothetical protein B0H17DRAFT_1067814 [Mycena rosella]|uniref:Uncharacterized protein n=1 Tax=Mycena rosella TaxID=1033263 RepID=A0AAD7DCV8_MYCRO|nr:hypothetical protein B0H17DRAFT_1067814 [Mycena rosella]